MEFFPTAEGYYDNISKKYVYQYKDHLGNIRLSYAKNPITQVLTIIDENNYYPFGLKHTGYNDYVATNNKFKYNSKELQDELGLTMYDYGARNYDPALCRWMVNDPIVHHSQSPYSAFNGNPIYWADPSGMAGEHYDWDTGKYVNDKGKEVSFDTALASVTGNDNEKSGGNDSEGNNEGQTGGNTGEGGDPPKKDWKYYLKGLKGIFTGGERKGNLQVAEFPEAVTFFLGGAEQKFVSYSGKTLEALVSTEKGAQATEKVASIATKIKAGDISIYAERIETFVYKGKTYILDGHHRIEAAKSVGTTIEAVELSAKAAYAKYASKIEEIIKGLH